MVSERVLSLFERDQIGMDFHRDGPSSIRPPILDGSNYGYWKARMRAYLKSIDERVWFAVVNGWSPPMYMVDDKLAEKPIESWDRSDYEKVGWNSKAINAIFSCVSSEEFRRISTCEIAKEAWTILETTHEGTMAVKLSKLQRLTTSFETLRMEENETFDEFYAKLSDIVNSNS